MIFPAEQSHGPLLEERELRGTARMILLAIILLFALAGLGLSLLRLSRREMRRGAEYNFDSAPFEGLFADQSSGGEAEPENETTDETTPEDRQALLERARRGDLQALSDAHATRDAGLYREALSALMAHAGARQERLEDLVSHVVQKGDLRASPELADLMIRKWEKTPGRNAAIEMLHVSALSDDPPTFQRAMDSAFSAWSAGRLDLSAGELLSLIAKEYWVLSPDARRSGGSFLLKRHVSEIRRRLARRGLDVDEEGNNHEWQ